MGKIIGVINEKGGVGKTSGVITFSEILGLAGYNVLLIDFDPQRNATSTYKREEDKDIVFADEQYLDLFCKKVDKDTVKNMLLPTDYENVSLLPGSEYFKTILYDIYNLNTETNGAIRPILQQNLLPLKDDFDYIIIDNSPFDSETSKCSICASDFVLTPVNADGFSFDGIVALTKTIADINGRYGTNVNFKGIYFNRTNMNTNLYRQLKEEYGEIFQDLFIPICIRQSNLVAESNTVMIPLVSYAKRCAPVKDYLDLLSAINLIDLTHIRIFNQKLNGGLRKNGK